MTTTYKLEIKQRLGIKVEQWKGRATPHTLAAWVDDFHRSLEVGGKNFYLTQARGHKPLILYARIVTEKTGKVVAEWTGATTMKVSLPSSSSSSPLVLP